MRLHSLALAATLVACATPAQAGALYVFGDSLSDTGNFSLIAGQVAPLLGPLPAPPYATGRATNGPVAVEYLAAALGLPPLAPALLPGAGGTNYAVIGAATGEVPIPGGGGLTADNLTEVLVPGIPLPSTSLLAQVALFVGTLTQPIDPDALFFVWGGANDLAINSADTVADAAADNVGAAVQALHSAGARRFLVPNLPDLSQTPSGTTALGDGSVRFNQRLATNLAGLSLLPAVQLIGFDTYSFFNAVRANGAAFGFTNVEDECFLGGPIGFGGGVTCADPASYLFWDGSHPSARGHQLLGAALADAVEQSSVPEPMSLTLAALGLAAVAVRRGRRAA